MILYSLLFYLLVPFILLRLWYRGVKAPQYRKRLLERFGFFNYVTKKNDSKKIIWLHAVSVGEVLAAKPLIEALLKNTQFSLVVTCTTPTGSEQINRLFIDRVFHVYIPYDLPGSVNRFINKVKPNILLIMETEIWPNIISSCHKKNIPTVLINGRLSKKSLKRYQNLKVFSQNIFKKITLICAQADSDAQAFKQLGVSSLVVTGSIKSDIVVSKKLQKELEIYKEKLFGNVSKRVLIAASTHSGEDELILSTFVGLKETNPDLLLVVVPRHPERFDEVSNLSERMNLATLRKSQNRSIDQNTDVYIVDSMGELFLHYGLADIAIVGGTFIEHGGHNFLEPAAWGLPIISGESVYNFSSLASELESLGVLKRINNKEELISEVKLLLSNSHLREMKEALAKSYLNSKRGALEKVMQAIDPLLK